MISLSIIRHSYKLLAPLLLTVMMGIFSPPMTLATSQHDKMAYTIMNLMKSNQRWIEIDLSRQRLVAWEGPKAVYAVIVSTGKPSTPTRVGSFKIETKHRTTRMTGDTYDFPAVPYTMYYDGGMAIHGADWHNLFGNPVTHGCTNVAVNHAKWLFEWADLGTPVIVHRSEAQP